MISSSSSAKITCAVPMIQPPTNDRQVEFPSNIPTYPDCKLCTMQTLSHRCGCLSFSKLQSGIRKCRLKCLLRIQHRKIACLKNPRKARYSDCTFLVQSLLNQRSTEERKARQLCEQERLNTAFDRLHMDPSILYLCKYFNLSLLAAFQTRLEAHST